MLGMDANIAVFVVSFAVYPNNGLVTNFTESSTSSSRSFKSFRATAKSTEDASDRYVDEPIFSVLSVAGTVVGARRIFETIMSGNRIPVGDGRYEWTRAKVILRCRHDVDLEDGMQLPLTVTEVSR